METPSSEMLQKQNLKLYEEFFARNSIIASWTFYAPWSPIWFWKRWDRPVMKSASNTRLYIGISLTEDTGVEFGNISYFEIQNSRFNSERFLAYHTEAGKIQQFLEQELKAKGLKIEILSEWARGHCMGFSWTFASTLCFALLKAWFIENEKKAFDIAKMIGSITKYWNSSWENEAFTWFAPKGVQVYSPEMKNGFIKIVESADRLPYYHGILFCGVESSTKAVEATNSLPHRDIERLSKALEETEWLKRYLQHDWDAKEIYEHLLQEKYKKLLIPCIKHATLTKELSAERNNEIAEKDFFRNVMEIQGAIESIDWDGYFTKIISKIFWEIAPSNDDRLWIFPVYSSNLWWSYVFFIKKTPSAPAIVKKLLEKAKEYFPWIRLEHLSDCDDRGESSLKIEQDLERWMAWKFKDPNKVTFLQPGKEAIRIYPHEIGNIFTEGVLVDMISRKLYVNGEPLNSKDHPSQHTMVQVLALLLESPTWEINSKELGASSYTKSKSEMSSKIFTPFIKLMSNRLGKTVRFTCRGSMSEFYIRFEHNGLPIGILRT